MQRIDPTRYEHVWTVEGVPYIFDSLYFSVGFTDYDFIAVNENSIHTLYVGKESLEVLGKLGLELHSTGFQIYKEKTTAKYAGTREFISRERTQDLERLSNEQLLNAFERFVSYLQDLCLDYFWTEKFCLGKVEGSLETSSSDLDTTILSSNVAEMGRLKLEQRELLNGIALYPPTLLDRYAADIAQRFEITDIATYHFRELLDLLRGNKVQIPDRSIVLRGTFSGWQDILGAEAKEIVTALRAAESAHEVPNEFTGKIGNKGYYKGHVRVVKLRVGDQQMFRELEAVQSGEVLVSESTGPDMLLAMKKAGAIVTEAGGITSHAAIVSRELNIPCVIDVKRVTQHLKTGDLVEVDADKGVVRILKE